MLLFLRRRVANCNKIGNTNDGQPHEFTIELIDNYCWCFYDGKLITVAYDPNFQSLKGNYCFGQLHGNEAYGTDRLYSLVAYTDVQPKKISETVATYVSEIFGNNVPLSGPSLRLGPLDQNALYNLDLMVDTGIIRNIEGPGVLKIWSAEGYPTELHLGNNPDPTQNGDVILRKNTSTFGLELVIGGTTAAHFPDVGIAPRSIYIDSIGFGSFDTVDSPSILWGEDAPEGVVSANRGSIYLCTGNGNVYRKSTAAENTGWVSV